MSERSFSQPWNQRGERETHALKHTHHKCTWSHSTFLRGLCSSRPVELAQAALAGGAIWSWQRWRQEKGRGHGERWAHTLSLCACYAVYVQVQVCGCFTGSVRVNRIWTSCLLALVHAPSFRLPQMPPPTGLAWQFVVGKRKNVGFLI